MNTQEQLAQLKATEAAKALQVSYELSRKNVGVTILLSVLMPLLAYAYTGRWKQFGVLLLGGAFLGALIGGVGKASFDNVIGITSLIGIIASSLDNTMAINAARAAVNA